MRRVFAVAVAALVLGCGVGCSSGAGPKSSSAASPSPLSPSAASSSRSATTSIAGVSPGSSSAGPPAPLMSADSRVAASPPLASTSTSAATSPTHPPARPTPTGATVTGRGRVIVLDPGHNGGNASHIAEIDKQVPMGFGRYKPCNTTGTSTNAGYPEHKFTFDVAERVRSILRAHGFRVLLTRPNDIGVGPCVNERAAYGHRVRAVAVVAIHADGAPSSGHGFHVCTASRQPVGASNQTMTRSHDMAVDIHNALKRTSGLVPSTYIGSNGYFPRSDLAGLNLSVRPTTFLELGNMRNPHDAGLDSSSTGRAHIAKAIAAGILAYVANP